MADKVFDKRINAVKRFAYLAYAFLLPFSDWADIKWNSILLILLSGVTLIQLCFDFKRFNIFSSSQFYILSGIFFIQLLSLFQSGDYRSIESGLMIKLPFLLFPFIMLISGVDEKDWELIKKVFILGCLFALFLSFRFLIFHQFNIKDLFQYHKYENYLILHRPYFGIYLLTAIVFLFENKIFYPYSYLLILLFVFFLWLIQAKMSLLIFALILFFYILSNTKKTYKKWVLICGILFSILIVVFSINFYLNNRNRQDLLSKKALFLVLSMDTRLIQWDCAWDLVNQNLILGVGEGKIKDELNACYMAKHPFTFQFLKNYNVHNEFLEEGVRHGMIGILTYLIIFFFFFRISISSGDGAYLSFLVIIVFASLTETTFSRSQGVLLIAFINSVMYLRSVSLNHPKLSSL